ncbi:MAG: chemotaxis protein CheD [Rhizobiales bacterium]|nr:chemotaxis protein CheD [Hyphomicrobiales bacterium]
MSDERVNIVQGEFAVGDKPEVVIQTLLGSCVAVCAFDPVAGVGGMNHFLLPGDSGSKGVDYTVRHGAYLMELLINGILKRGADRKRLNAKIFGGANTVKGIGEPIGQKNIDFARRYLGAEMIPIVSESVGGSVGRRLKFWPASGRAQQAYIAPPKEEFTLPYQKVGNAKAGEIELF